MQQSAAAQALAAHRMQEFLAKAQNDAARLSAADGAREQGDIARAVKLYVRLGLAHNPNESTLAARDRLKQLATEAQKKMRRIDATLKADDAVSPGESAAGRRRAELEQANSQRDAKILAAFAQYDKLLKDYGEVSTVANELKTHVAKQRRCWEYAVVLNEPKAKTLWDVGCQHEANGHSCCAYWTFLEASRLVPAPSAQQAKRRVDEMAQDPEVLAAAKACREMQKCHKDYDTAARLAKFKPDAAKELFQKVVARAPANSEVYREARRQLADLR